MKPFKNILFFLFLLICVSTIQQAYAQTKAIALYKGIVIKHSVTIKKQLYHFEGADSLSVAPIIIEGNNIIIDFNGAIVEGSTDIETPDKFKGTGIIIKSGKNITIKNLIVKGYKVGLMAKGINYLHIKVSDFSYNYRQHLNSTRDREDLADWQSYHHNEDDEWLRYGAGIYLRDCNHFDLRYSKITNGQCGLMLTSCNDGVILENNLSFNSGLGIGMYRSSRNLINQNNIDWNVRGYSDGVYYRGQDSAGILVFEQCNNNLIIRNTVTHSGDGFFLWAGQSTMDTGLGGCNDNVLYENDFSYAPTNGVELTFSRNRVIKNIIHDCWHGVWGGFSYNSIIADNSFAGNMSAIAIEHGMKDTIAQNHFKDDKVAIELWSNPKMAKSYGYVQKRDTRSVNYLVSDNTFTNVKKVLNIHHTDSLAIVNNKLSESNIPEKLDSTVTHITLEKNTGSTEPKHIDYDRHIDQIKSPKQLPESYPRGRKYIMMNDWGPYNFSYPIAWWQKTDSTGVMHFDMMGPQGDWEIVKMKGVSQPSKMAGKFSDNFAVKKDTSATTDIDIEFTYIGSAVTSPFGLKYPPGYPYTFHYREFNASTQWQMQWFAFDDSNEPLKHEAEFKKLIVGNSVKTSTGKLLADVFGKNFGKNIARQKIATVSTTEINVPAASYRLGISASELVKLYVDGKLVIKNWDPAKLKNDEDNHKDAIIKLSGKHTIRVEQAQYSDYGMLNFRLEKM
ncbi:right-handed parallel beta-helix repeat-containing protein [Mucilaginibacter flavidus]|uniref:right-handed parallel beta-helix repeat-containing protein n=1 Tax=Mucilaginibacter flavidus TaxID=2949309 RepID=UPI0020931A2E|nr:right-handed parallel beta-helix repeat-containing protein [Mucilaginibacter flavidus]MCO5947375.1 right-handed parallel beta-helix repeat-containing protein [Mucilaginibacter flavidus]